MQRDGNKSPIRPDHFIPPTGFIVKFNFLGAKIHYALVRPSLSHSFSHRLSHRCNLFYLHLKLNLKFCKEMSYNTEQFIFVTYVFNEIPKDLN